MAEATHRQVDWMQQISFHPDYLEHFLRTQNFFMYDVGPLRYDYRHYIAIMAASRHQCRPLINYHTKKFIAIGGDLSWLQGLEHTPKQIRKLSEANKILARSPWLLNRSHIEKITSGRENFTVGEMCQALVLLAHFHCLCSFVCASQILDFSEEESAVNNVIPEDESYHMVSNETVEELMQKMSLHQRKEDEQGGSMNPANNPYDLPDYETDGYEASSNGNSLSDNGNRRGFFIHEWSWDHHVYSILNRYYDDVGRLLDEKFKVAYDLTYYTMGHKHNVDTTIFRRAVWNYIHKIYGILHDDYDYAAMEDLLDTGFRSYADTVCFHPENITRDAYDQIMRAFRPSEKVHVNLMLFEARMQAELMYAVCAITDYMR